jgi:mannose-6-phosphate isomerase-like protein (cupin superfamily)
VSEVVLVPPGEGELVGDAPERRVEILSDHETLHATWSRYGPHREGADLHVHRHHTDLFYVLEGELTIRLGVEDRPAVVPAGTLARVPPLVVHGFRNGSDAEVRYLNLHAPGMGFADFLRAMRDGRDFSYDQHAPPDDGGRAASEAVVGRGEPIAAGADRGVTLLADVDSIAVAEIRTGPGSPPPPLHVHRRHAESFYVLEGQLTLTAGDREVRAAAGSWVQVPPGVPHTLVAAGDRPARFLDLHTPSCGFGDFLRALRGAGDGAERAAGRTGFDEVLA